MTSGRRHGRRASGVVAVALALAAALLVPESGRAQPTTPTAPGGLEGRPPAAEVSPLQAAIDAAAPGSTVEVEPGEYRGDLVIDKPLRLLGRGRPLLVGSGSGSVVRVRAADVTVEGFEIDGRRGGNLGRDSAGVHSSGLRTTLRDLRIRDSLFGVYLREAHDSAVLSCRIRGIAGLGPGERGSGIHLWDTQRFRLERNDIAEVRDGFYIQSSSNGVVRGNSARDLRYGLHYMFSDDNVFEGNTFENGDAGTAIMYSKRIVFRRNRFLRNRGYASVGLLFKTCDDVLAEDNLIADNARGIFLDDAYRAIFRRNLVAGSDVAIVLYTGSGGVRFEGNSFVGNMSPLNLVGKRTDTVFLGNYWSENDEPDLDGDGRSDRPYRLASVFDHLRGNLTAADLLAGSFAAAALGAAERTFPVLEQVAAEDTEPLARPPALLDVPRPEPRETTGNPRGVAAALTLGAAGAMAMVRGRRLRAAAGAAERAK
jgi:nitrous oxidase accessory protein